MTKKNFPVIKTGLLITLCIAVYSIQGNSPGEFESPRFEKGTGDLQGWSVYKDKPAVHQKNAPNLVKNSAGRVPLETAALFYASLIRGDQKYRTLLTPDMKPSLRAKLQEGISRKGQLVKTWYIKGIINRKGANKVTPFKNKVAELEKTFGKFDRIIFSEDKSGRWDSFMFLREKNNRWYIVLVGGPFFR